MTTQAEMVTQARLPRMRSPTIMQIEVRFSFEPTVWLWHDCKADADGLGLFARAMAGEFGAIAPYVAPPPPVPAAISDRQFAHELRSRGVITQAEALAFLGRGEPPPALNALLAALPAAQRDDAALLLIGATVFERAHPLTPVLAAGFGWDASQTDQFFRDAAAR